MQFIGQLLKMMVVKTILIVGQLQGISPVCLSSHCSTGLLVQ